MISFNAKVLNGLPVFVEAETVTDRDEGVIVDDIQIYWRKTNRLGCRTRAHVIENKMTENDWECVELDALDIAEGRWIG